VREKERERDRSGNVLEDDRDALLDSDLSDARSHESRAQYPHLCVYMCVCDHQSMYVKRENERADERERA
jgi:hypothetical protein